MVSGLEFNGDDEDSVIDPEVVEDADYWIGTDHAVGRGAASSKFQDARYFEEADTRVFEGPGFEVFFVREDESPTGDEGIAYNATDPENGEYGPAFMEFAQGIMRDIDDVDQDFIDEVENELRQESYQEVRADGGTTGIPVGGAPSYVDGRDVDEDRAYMGDFPM
ncbi:MAG: hypothetical protein ABEI58_04475 [Candidatus Nanohaloarchaea archaeon]